LIATARVEASTGKRRRRRVGVADSLGACLGLWLFSSSLSVGAEPSLRIEPEARLLFDDVLIVIEGVAPATEVVLTASLVDDQGRTWSSRGVYFADSDGRVALDRQASVEGTYTGIEPDGFLWSMLPVPTDRLDPLPKRNPEWPRNPSLSPEKPVEIELVAEVWSAPGSTLRTRVEGTHTVSFMREGVRRTRIVDAPFEGVLFEPPGAGPHPAVLLVTGSNGGAWIRVASLLASHDLTALALAHFNYPGRPDDLVEIPLEYFYGATNWLRKRTGAPRIGLYGNSRGGEAVLLLASLNPEPFGAVVSNAPSNVVWGGCCTEEAFAQPAWTFRGEPIRGYWLATGRTQPDPVDEILYFLPGVLDPGPAAIPVERIRAPILLQSGDSDRMWPSRLAADRVLQRLRENGFSYPTEHVTYAGAGHTATSTGPVTSLSGRGGRWPSGGTPALNAAARKDSFHRRVEFLRAHLSTGPATSDPNPDHQ